jgi:hypothetical protein
MSAVMCVTAAESAASTTARLPSSRPPAEVVRPRPTRRLDHCGRPSSSAASRAPPPIASSKARAPSPRASTSRAATARRQRR